MTIATIEESRAPSSFKRARWLSRAISLLLAIGMWGTVLGGVAMAIAVLFFFQILAVQAGDAWARLSDMPAEALGLWQRLVLVADFILYTAPQILILFNLQKLFAQFARGEIFSDANIMRLRAVGLWLVISVATSCLAQLIFFRVAAVRNPDFDLEILSLLFGAMTYVAAHVMAEAQRIATDHAEIV